MHLFEKNIKEDSDNNGLAASGERVLRQFELKWASSSENKTTRTGKRVRESVSEC